MYTEIKKFKRSGVARAVITALCGTATMMVAQETLAQGQTSLQRVEVTGSNIRRADAETASPVQTVTREELDRSGKTTVAEYLQTLSVDNQGSVPTTFGSGFASGASGISLRGLGAASTLVLINGRRIAPYGLADDGQKVFADLNVIPLEAVERVEILKDGGSAIYGSDAMAGVINVILRKNYTGTVAKASYGQSRYGDGGDTRASITHGFGSMESQGFNVLLNLEVGKRQAIYNRDRKGRGTVGRSDLRPEGFDAETSGGVSGGTGAIIAGGGAAVSSVAANVRSPVNNLYYSRTNQDAAATGFTRVFPGADCNVLSRGYPQGDPGGGCLTDASQDYTQIQPSAETLNLFARGARQLNANTEAYAEFNFYRSDGRSQTTPSGVHGSVGSPIGPVNNADQRLGADHPDNPFFGSSARLRYLATDVGPRVSNTKSDFTRFVAGLKGVWGAWDYDTAFLFSQTDTSNTRTGYLQRDVAFALLNPTAANVAAAMSNPAYAALPPGTFWRIAENAGLNSPGVYAALSPAIASDAKARTTQVDFKASRELGQLAGGPIGLALGAEIRRETNSLEPTTGTSTGNIIGLGYSAFDSTQTVYAAYAEGLFPVTKQIELSAAVRADHYSTVGTSLTPKLGAKWRVANNLAVRGTYAQAFRAPSAPERGEGGVALSFFTTASDPTRCALGITSACSAASVAGLTSGNPNLDPEKATSVTVGTVWDITPKTSLTVDLWEIKRKNEINQQTTTEAIANGNVARDPGGALFAGDPGPITAVLINFINSSRTTVRGVDLDFKHRMDLAPGNKVDFGVIWTHLLTFKRTDPDGSSFEWAGTIGNHDVTNATGTPKDRINIGMGWDIGRWRLGGIVNYRGALINKLAKDDADCASHLANGDDAPSGCKIKSFTTLDLSARYRFNDRTEIFGGIQNALDTKPPLDPITYGAVSYNPLDYRGAVGRFYYVGVRHQFR
jgi:iron complex outermembrane receptor protein